MMIDSVAEESSSYCEGKPEPEQSPVRFGKISDGERRSLAEVLSILSGQLAVLNSSLSRVLEYLPEISSPPILVNGKMTQLVTRDELAVILGVRPNTVDRWAKNGTIPEPLNPEKGRRGRKFLRYDLFTVIDWIQRYR